MPANSATKHFTAKGMVVAFALLLAACSLGAPGYRGPVASNFDGVRFYNQSPTTEKSLWDALNWRLHSESVAWEDRKNRAQAGPPPNRVALGQARVTWINHATVLVQVDGLNILTDPIWSERAGPYSWIGPSRYRRPGIAFENLPRVDLVLLSHNHYDHCDLPTLRTLAQRDKPRIIAGLGTRAFLKQEGIESGEDIGWWQELRVDANVSVFGVPAQHWSRRGLSDTANTLWLGFVIRSSTATVYFAGDTAWGPHFEQIYQRFGPIGAALLPIGAYKPRWFMKSMHISPDEAANAAVALHARVSIPMHYGTFHLGDDGQDEPVADLLKYVGTLKETPHFVVLDMGEGLELGH